MEDRSNMADRGSVAEMYTSHLKPAFAVALARAPATWPWRQPLLQPGTLASPPLTGFKGPIHCQIATVTFLLRIADQSQFKCPLSTPSTCLLTLHQIQSVLDPIFGWETTRVSLLLGIFHYDHRDFSSCFKIGTFIENQEVQILTLPERSYNGSKSVEISQRGNCLVWITQRRHTWL